MPVVDELPAGPPPVADPPAVVAPAEAVRGTLEVRALGVLASSPGEGWEGGGFGVHGGVRVFGPLFVEAGADLVVRDRLPPRVAVAPALRLFGMNPYGGRGALSLAVLGGVDLRPGADEVHANPLLGGEVAFDIPTDEAWRVRVAAGYQSHLTGPGAMAVSVGGAWMPRRQPPAPAVAAMPQAVPAWLGAPACDWSSPGARDAVIDQLRAQQSGSGSALSDGDVSLARLVVKAAPGSTVTIVSRVPDGAAGADASDDEAVLRRVAGADGLVRYDHRGLREVLVTVVGAGESVSHERHLMVPGDTLWLRGPSIDDKYVRFQSGSSELGPEMRAALAALVQNTGAWTWEVHGSYSADGDLAHNLELARARADAVRAALLAGGLLPAQVVMGEVEAPNPDEEPEYQRATHLRPVPPAAVP
jgi:outer membrane protein OmpA-like peptidoglycan-associated protein